MSNAWRLEGEITHSRNEIEQGSRTYPDLEYPPYGGNVLVGTIGHISSLTIMGNIWYDLQVSKKVNVYFGGGIGSSHYRFDDIALLVYPTPYVQVLEKKPVFDDTEWSFTSQLGTGVEYKICDKLMLGIGARYLITPEISVKVDDMDYDGEQQRYTFDFSHMNILLGLRFFF